MNPPSYWQPLVIGQIILLGVILDSYGHRLSFADLLRRLRGGTQPLPDRTATTLPGDGSTTTAHQSTK